MRSTPRWIIYAVAAVAFVTVGVPIFQLVLRASLGIIAMVLAGGIALAFTAVAAIVLYMVVQVVVDKLRGW
ncbi:MAG: hypothetical protein KGS10_09550 [Chloroflexi bacterium]|jgi:hypothetical protein|nr:hypothetical protein [Chloroflexota bacterium]